MAKTIWNKQPKKNKMKPKQNSDFIVWLMDIGSCQICGSSNIDIPHHIGIGVKRNDYKRILLCVDCHRKVHNSLYSWHIQPDLDIMKQIAKENWENFNESRSTYNGS